MCGIISVKNLKDNHPVNNLVKILYENQKYRGQQGFGFVGLNAERIDTYRATDEKGIIKYLNEYQYDEIIFHHRLPTSTQNTLKSAHPFVIEMKSRRYYFMHNGVIQNAEKLKEKHSKKGIKYSSREGTCFNDSEALGWDFCLWLNKKQKKIEAAGSVAFVCLETDKKTNRAIKLYFYRNDRTPLKVYRDKTLFLIASCGNYAEAEKSWLYFWDYQKGRIERHKFLHIQPPELFNLDEYDYSYFDDAIDLDAELDLLEIKADIAALKRERDYLLSAGKYVEAETMDEEVEELKEQYKKTKRLLNASESTPIKKEQGKT